ncbi:CHAT domain-containing protein [Streptomyces sp. NPDC049585]|uniref:CHAT domain-containing protein n=1 Tax=Streptomyces sp. NPDC049585 TaxID=3155154 RepID=UPI003434384C
MEYEEGAAPWSAESRDEVLAGRTHCNVAMALHEVRDRLTPEGVGPVGSEVFVRVYMAAYYYLARYFHLPEAKREWDRHAGWFLFGLVHAADPRLVPEAIREVLDQHTQAVVPAYETVHAVGSALLLSSERDGFDEGVFASAVLVAWAREEARGTPSEPSITFTMGSALVAAARCKDAPPESREEGIRHMREALAALPAGDPFHALMLTELRRTLAGQPPATHPDGSPEAEITTYIRDGGRERLDRAVDLLRTIADAPTTGEQERSRRRAELGQALRIRFELTGELADLDASIAELEAVLAAGIPDPETRASASSFLGVAHLARYIQLQEPPDLEAATRAARDACDDPATAASPAHPQRLTNRASVLTMRYRVTGDLADIDRAVGDLAFAVQATPPSQHDHPVMVIKLAVALEERAVRTGDVESLDAAEKLLRPLVGTPADTGRHQLLARMELGDVLFVRARMTGDASALAAAIDQYEAIARASAQDIRSRLICARRWATAALELGALEVARTALGVALAELLPKLAGRALGRESQEARLREQPPLATTVATVSLMAGETREALVRLEQGRGVLLAQALQLRGRQDELRAASRPLADRFEQVCAELVAPHRSPEERRKAAGDFDALVEKIRALPGTEDFQRPPTWEKLREAAAHGPVAVINVSPPGCFALLLTPTADGGALDHLPLKVTAGDIATHAETFRTAVAALADPSTPGPERYRHDVAMKATLRWLGTHIAGPVLNRLRPGHQPPPRLWWCPTGVLSLLPLHAAVLEDGAYVHDRVVSSYVPTLGSLLHARSRPAPEPGRASLVAVAVDAGPYPRLHSLDAELAAASALQGPRDTLRDTDATPEAVRAALRTHTHAHLACHGVRDPDAPSRSRLLLHGGELTLRELAAERLPDAEFAYLSACHSAATGEELADEVLSVASAFQLCGYRHVIGSLWTVTDAMGPLLAGEVYRNLAAPDAPGPAHALHRAVGALRTHDDYNDPLFWASVVHSGP